MHMQNRIESSDRTEVRGRSALCIRAASEDDVAALAALVAEQARLGHLLPRSAEHIRASLPNWQVAELNGVIIGCGSLVAMGQQLAEVRSLVVAAGYRSAGVGGLIVQALVAQGQAAGVATVFALTRAVGFFERLGFHITAKERFPEKVWRDCAVCPIQQCCDETAMVRAVAGEEVRCDAASARASGA